MSQKREKRKIQGGNPSGTSGSTEFEDHNLDEQVPEITDVCSAIDAALNAADSAVRKKQVQQVEETLEGGVCGCFGPPRRRR